MKFKCIEKDVEMNLERFSKLAHQNKLNPVVYGGEITDPYYMAIITALRMNHVNMEHFFNIAFEDWENIVNKMVDGLPRYIQENLKDYEIKEDEEL